MNVGIHPALNRLLAGVDMVMGGVRMILNAAGPADVEGLRQQTAQAFEERAKFEAATARALILIITQATVPPDSEIGKQLLNDLELFKARSKLG